MNIAVMMFLINSLLVIIIKLGCQDAGRLGCREAGKLGCREAEKQL